MNCIMSVLKKEPILAINGQYFNMHLAWEIYTLLLEINVFWTPKIYLFRIPRYLKFICLLGGAHSSVLIPWSMGHW